MTATRVFNPLLLGEFCKIGAASPAASAMSRNLPCSRQVNRIKRDLFGPANPIETNKIFNEEINKHQERANKKWGFDFRAGQPLASNSQYIWERVGVQESTHAPEMYTLTRAAHVRPTECNVTDSDLLLDERAERENFSGDLSASTDNDDSCYDSQDESLVVFKVPVRHTNALSPVSTSRLTQQLRKRQPKITEYMKERKRLAQTPKKLSPAKRLRTSSGSSSSSNVFSSSSSNSSSVASSISSHFIALKRQRNQ